MLQASVCDQLSVRLYDQIVILKSLKRRIDGYETCYYYLKADFRIELKMIIKRRNDAIGSAYIICII